ncbi:MAG: sulfate ABC transporter permease subunit CysT, partial [Methylococcaceae bacterium]|nr:sulfate ABC transporter permease subunit CysT [Methylococcaceae bacterium]
MMNKTNILPGFRPALGFTLLYLGLVVLIPLSTLFFKTLQPDSQLTWQGYIHIISNDRVQAAFSVSFLAALLAAAIALVFGFIIAWTLVRYSLPAKRFFDAIIDLPFALPTAVAGIVLASLYAPNGLIGKPLTELGFKVAFTPAGIVIALIFIGLPFIVRTIEPVLQEIDASMEEAASSMGATRWQIFQRIIFPNVFPAALTGFAMAFARGVGEYGSVIFIAGNLPYVSEIVPLLIITKLEQYDYEGATALALTMLLVSFVILLTIN